MNKIEKHNIRGVCAEEFCDDPQTYYANIKINNLNLHLNLCSKHAQQWDSKHFAISKTNSIPSPQTSLKPSSLRVSPSGRTLIQNLPFGGE